MDKRFWLKSYAGLALILLAITPIGYIVTVELGLPMDLTAFLAGSFVAMVRSIAAIKLCGK